MFRILAVDWGEKRIGFALSDKSQRIAYPLKTIENQGLEVVISMIKKICQENKVEKIILGLPLGLDGKETKQAERVKRIKEILNEQIDLPIIFEDERLTSKMGKQFKLNKKKNIDQIAAQILLQGYLDRKQKDNQRS